MRYKIEITEIGTEEKICGKEWKLGASSKTHTAESDEGYGYTPEILKLVDYSRVIYRQEADDIDLPVIILAFNDIKLA